MNRIRDVMRVNGNVFIAGLTGAGIDLGRDLDLQGIQWYLTLGSLNQEHMRQAASQHSQLQFRRAWTKIVTGEIRPTIAENLKVTNADTPYSAAAFNPRSGSERMGTGAVGFRLFPSLQQCLSFLCQVFVEITHALFSPVSLMTGRIRFPIFSSISF